MSDQNRPDDTNTASPQSEAEMWTITDAEPSYNEPPEGVVRDPLPEQGEDGSNVPEGVIRDPISENDESEAAPIWEGDEESPDRDNQGSLKGDRGISPVGGSGASKNQKMIGLVAFLAVCGALGFAVMQGDGEAKDKKPAAESGPARAVVDYEGAAPPPPPTLGAEGEAAIISGEEPGLASAVITGDEKKEVDPRIARMEESRRAGVMAFSSGAGSLQGMARSAAGAMSGHPDGSEGNRTGLVSAVVNGIANGERTELDGLRNTSSINRARARMLPNRNFLITAGTQIPCTLQTAMDTSTPGYVTCLVSRDIYSDNGNVVLMERGTRVLGEYRGGMSRGQNRVFVVWNRAVTPRGVAVDLASPAADSLGRSGMSGDIENFFWQRFGGAILLSVVDDAVTVAARSNEDARNTVRQPSNAASIALENSINIPPVLRKAQGELVTIMAANDFDFSSVYGLSLR